ncbi:unnamed protein product [Caenorhabditis brenneri]
MMARDYLCFQKYYPADFDLSKLQKANRAKEELEIVQRVMVPFNMQCNSCAEFQFNCPNCMAHITIETDLEHCDYKNEHGATR